ncbi:MAG: glycoside hydrolase family 43 protein [Treponema sp.]|nr:glycoside hydrolase family 43 protein [Treponema sp.]
MIAMLLSLGSCAKEPAVYYSNPLGVQNAADPFVLKTDDGYYCYATSSSRGFLAWRSTNLVDWEAIGIVFNAMRSGQWASADFWAPEVVAHNGKYYLYYSGRWMANGSLRIGVAISESPAGPFIDALGRPLFDQGYAVIDAHVFSDSNGQKYLYYSRDCSENTVNGNNESHIYGALLADDLLSLAGEPVLLAQPEQAWEDTGSWHWNEAPFVIKHDNDYYLLYSANHFAMRSYSVGYAVSRAPLGPFVKYDHNPVLYAPPEQAEVSGPGHLCVTSSRSGNLYAVYHIHIDSTTGGGARQLAIDPLGFRADGSLYIDGPSFGQQKAIR